MSPMTNMSALVSVFTEAINECDLERIRKILDYCRENHCSRYLELNKALCLAARNGSTAVVELILLRARPPPSLYYTDETGKKALHHAVSNGSLEMVKFLTRAGSVLNSSDSEGKTPLLLACARGFTDIVRFLISEGSHVNLSRNHNDERALHIAAGAGHVDVVRILLEEGRANLDVQTSVSRGGVTPLHKACRNGHTEVVKLLCERGADLEVRDSENRRAVHLAAESDSLPVVELLIRHGAEVQVSDKYGMSLLHYAVSVKNVAMVEMVLDTGRVDVNVPNLHGEYPIHIAIVHKLDRIVELLVSAGANIHVMTPHNDTPLLLAASIGSYHIVDILLKEGADVNAKSADSSTALHKVQYSRCNNTERDRISNILIEYGANINCQDNRGFTPLHSTACKCLMGQVSVSSLRILVGAGAKVSHDIPNRNSPLCWLVWNGGYEAARFLVQAGWNLNQEAWIDLPGKTEEQSIFHQWLKHMRSTPWTLASLCRQNIRNYLLDIRGGQEIVSTVRELPIPTKLKGFLTLAE